jgi:hypothetical protein
MLAGVWLGFVRPDIDVKLFQGYKFIQNWRYNFFKIGDILAVPNLRQ